VTAEQELPGVDEYADRLETAHRAATWPGIQKPTPDSPATGAAAAEDPTADLRELILRLLQR
jgi:hypothetical protein